MSTVTTHDEEILNVIFNPESGLSLDDSILSSTQPPPPPPIPPSLLDSLKSLEKDAITLAEQSNFSLALDKLSKCITKCPHYASAYNNRAQTHRLLGNNHLALRDLQLAIQYAASNSAVLKQAYTQRAILKMEMGDVPAAEADFAMGARYGNEIAKQHVRNNPYAKLCNAMVMDAMAKLSGSIGE